MQTHLQTTYLRQLATWCSLHGWLNRFDKGFYLAFATISHSTSSEIRSSIVQWKRAEQRMAKPGWLMLTMLTDLWIFQIICHVLPVLPCCNRNCSNFYHWGFVVELRQAGHAHHPSNFGIPPSSPSAKRHLKQPSYGVKPIKSRAESQILP